MTSPFLISASVLPILVTVKLLITLVPEDASPVNRISLRVPHPPPIVILLLIIVLPAINVSPVTELTVNTLFSGPPSQLLEITNVLVVCSSVVLTWNTSPTSYTSGSTSGVVDLLPMIT